MRDLLFVLSLLSLYALRSLYTQRETIKTNELALIEHFALLLLLLLLFDEAHWYFVARLLHNDRNHTDKIAFNQT